MAFESNPSTKETVSVRMTNGQGNNKTKRLNATTSVDAVSIPPRVSGVILKHASGLPVTIMFNSTVADGFVISPGDAPLTVPVGKGTDLKYRVVGTGASVGELYCLFY